MNGKPLEILAYQVAQKLFPDASIEHETVQVANPDGEVTIPDLIMQFPGSVVSHLYSEMTCSPLYQRQHYLDDPKHHQMRVMQEYLTAHPTERAVAWYGNNMTSPDVFLQTME